jgi:hypothetical protein
MFEDGRFDNRLALSLAHGRRGREPWHRNMGKCIVTWVVRDQGRREGPCSFVLVVLVAG